MGGAAFVQNKHSRKWFAFNSICLMFGQAPYDRTIPRSSDICVTNKNKHLILRINPSDLGRVKTLQRPVPRTNKPSWFALYILSTYILMTKIIKHVGPQG